MHHLATGLEFKGDVDLLDKIAHLLIGNWEGEVVQYFSMLGKRISEVDGSCFEPADKGGFSCWGCGADGKVICGLGYTYKSGGRNAAGYLTTVVDYIEVKALSSTKTHY